MRAGYILAMFLITTGAVADQNPARSQPMSYTACLATVEQIVHGTRFSRLLSTRDVQVVRIETETGGVLITCDRLEAKMIVRQGQGSKG